MLQIFILAEVRLFREALAVSLDRQNGIQVVGTSPARLEVATQIHSLQPDIVLFDMLMADGMSVFRSLIQPSQTARVVALAVGDNETEIVRCAEFGMCGLVDREASLEELLDTMRCAVRGEFRCSPRAAAAITRRLAWLSGNPTTSTGAHSLTCRELQIVGLIDRGLSNKEIASELGIEVATVKNHVHNVLDKLHVRRRGEAAAEVRSRGLIPAAAPTLPPPNAA